MINGTPCSKRTQLAGRTWSQTKSICPPNHPRRYYWARLRPGPTLGHSISFHSSSVFFTTPVLGTHCPACVRCFPPPTHPIQMNGPLSGHCRAWWQADRVNQVWWRRETSKTYRAVGPPISSLRKALSESFSTNQRLLPHVWGLPTVCIVTCKWSYEMNDNGAKVFQASNDWDTDDS